MSATLRRVIYVLSYELIAVTATTIGLWALGYSGSHSSMVAIVSSGTALVWNYVFNLLFEAWERRQDSASRTLARRVAHALGFEGGLVLILVPLLALILQVTVLEALVLEAGLLLFFLIYTFVFAWVFDQLVPAAHTKNKESAAANS
ncbi:PACE efflux transporter [Glutamicibacter sp.]|uniref:PACE efflux transporter n=1 Tax=Glutamicibacter sp. TaxID=1931995 RepID=UPI0028BF1F87|nr:PACE efflux transporter [Glutamicibacter sp.]